MKIGEADRNFMAFRRTSGGARYYCAARNGTALNTWSIVGNRAYASPFYCGITLPIDRLAFNVTSANATANARLGIYEDDGDCYPSNLVVDSGNFACNTTGRKEATIDIVLQHNKLYWLVIAANLAVSVRSIPVGAMLITFLGTDSTLPTAKDKGWYRDITYGALPDPFTSGGSVITANTPAVWIRPKVY